MSRYLFGIAIAKLLATYTDLDCKSSDPDLLPKFKPTTGTFIYSDLAVSPKRIGVVCSKNREEDHVFCVSVGCGVSANFQVVRAVNGKGSGCSNNLITVKKKKIRNAHVPVLYIFFIRRSLFPGLEFLLILL